MEHQGGKVEKVFSEWMKAVSVPVAVAIACIAALYSGNLIAIQIADAIEAFLTEYGIWIIVLIPFVGWSCLLYLAQSKDSEKNNASQAE